MSSDSYKNELILLQKEDTLNAIRLGFRDKKDWVNYLLRLNNDSIAESIINLAHKYNLDVYNVARDFDESMVSRILKIKSKNNS